MAVVLGRLGIASTVKNRRIFQLVLLLIVSIGLQVAFAVANNTSSGCGYGGYGYGYGCSVPCDSYVGSDGYVRCDGYVRGDGYVGCNAYVRCDGYVRADGYVGCDAYSFDGSTVGCDAYVRCNGVQCDAYPYCPSIGCDAYPGACPPDLVVTDVTAPTNFNKGDSVDISWTVMNVGNSTAEVSWPPWGGWGSWGDVAWLSSDPYLGGDHYLGYVSRNTALAGGDSYDVSLTVNVGNIPNGTYYLLVATDTGNNVSEANEQNNTLVMGNPVTVQGEDPDLAIASFNAPASVYKGESFDVSFMVQNQGSGPAVPFVYDGMGSTLVDGFYLSQDAVFDSGDTYAGIDARHSEIIVAGGSYEVTLPATIANVPAGVYYIIARTDMWSTIVETDESNNTAVVMITVSGPDPDLTPTGISAPESAMPNSLINASWTVYNQGEGIARNSNPWGGWGDYMYISRDTVPDSSDRILSVYWNNNSPLGPGQSYEANGGAWAGVGTGGLLPLSAYVPDLAPGNYYLIVVTDRINEILESDENNNVLTRPITIIAPDLTVSQLTAPASVEAGSHIDAAFTVYNSGNLDATGAWSDGLYISPDPSWDPSDSSIGVTWEDRSLNPLPPGGEQLNSYQGVYIPMYSPGTYYLIARADSWNYLAEGNETNNDLVQQITITPPSPPDLIVTSVNAPAVINAGSQISASWTVYNQGEGTAFGQWGCWYDQAYLSSDQVIDGADADLGSTSYCGALGFGASYTQTAGFNVPALPPGTYYLLVRSDTWNSVAESVEINNVAASGGVSVSLPSNRARVEIDHTFRSDLVVTIGVGDPGAPLWSRIISNHAGGSDDNLYTDVDLTEAAAFLPPSEHNRWFLKVSDEAGADIGDIRTFSIISDGVTYTAGDTPVPIYDYQTSYSYIPSHRPDLAITSLDVPTTASSGQVRGVNWTVMNQGSGAATGIWNDNLYFSTNANLDAGDSSLASHQAQFQAMPLLQGMGYVNADMPSWESITIPHVAEGMYYLILKTDSGDSLAESEETNNTLVRPIIIDNTPPVIADLTVEPTCNGVVVSWTTDEPADTVAGWWKWFWDTWTYQHDLSLTTSHSMTFSGLNAATTYNYGVGSDDAAGNRSSSQGSFTTSGKPELTLTRNSIFWASYADYTARDLSIGFTVSNRGVGGASSVRITGSTATRGVTLITGLPMDLGNLSGGAVTALTLKYDVPASVGSFIVSSTASADDDCGNSYTYP